ncbi:hypothetical protein JJL45_06355 [Tamlana sp. s12]|uniref:hypothetical protein n=1 Tax=Tamlana sp. s12 TaxID=1630406 RepID=UPI0007FF0A23|nr:hypothetical protein [Tamlana sp. s12]OBQ55889.1 hypothetical protein VQ01_05715 [Tamlana sp. s12]QQY83610.1 hypothetical protein JJL45_06355 [Tamlana sp. s12]
MGLIDAINETNNKAVNLGGRYAESSYKYYRLKVFKHFSMSVSLMLKVLFIGCLCGIFAILSAVSLALYIGEVIESYPLGFIIVALGFMVLSILAFLFRRVINHLVVRKLSEFFFD